MVALAVLAVPAGASRGIGDDGMLRVEGHGETVLMAISTDRGIARVVLSSPPGYAVRIDQRIGTELGFMNIILRRLDRGSHLVGGGRLRVADPDRYVADPVAQACAPGRHAAVWVAPVSTEGLPTLPIFIDPSPSGIASGVTFRFCPIWRAGAGYRVVATWAELTATEGLSVRLSEGDNPWSALVGPPGSSLEADESRAFELRALEPLPYTVTLRARHIPAKKTVVLRGRVVAAGKPVPQAEVVFGVVRKSLPEGSGVPFVGPALTSVDGKFIFRHRIAETTLYLTHVWPVLRGCSAASTAPAGCVSETIWESPSLASVRVRVRAKER